MSLNLTTITPPTPPKAREGSASPARWLALGLVALAAVGGVVGVRQGVGRGKFWGTPPLDLLTLELTEGPMAVTVVETGTVESSTNTTVKCQVEALLGLVGGTTGTQRSGGATPTSSTSGATASSSTSAASMSASLSKSVTATSSAKKKAQQATDSAASGESESSGGGGKGGSGGGSAAGGGAAGSAGASAGVSTGAVMQRPTIRSFTMTVPTYVSLQTKRASVSTMGKSSAQSGGGGGGNRGGGGGGGGGGGNGSSEKAGSTRIIMIRPEGDQVRAGDIVCEFDSASFKDAVTAQRIKAEQAKSALVQVQSILEVNQISLAEYRDGVLPQDVQLVRQYVSMCQTEVDRAKRNHTWSQETMDKGYRAPQQHQVDVYSLQRAETNLTVARLMEDRLVKATGPKLMRALEAKLQANRADALALEAAYTIENDRLKRLEKMVDACTLRAPHDGIVVYAVPAGNGWRPATTSIQEGATVREGQPIFELPDSKHMRIRAKINESKVNQVRVGQQALVQVDAFPDRPIKGTVTEVTLIPAPGSGPGSDVRIYFATVAVNTDDFPELRPGLSAQVTFLVGDQEKAARVPITALRWFGGKSYVAVATAPGATDQPPYRWRRVEVGLMSTAQAEIQRGVALGERIIATPEALPVPEAGELDRLAAPTIQVAGSVPGQGG